MNIAIYGDSFADYKHASNNKKTWMHFLEDKLNSKITCFANSGSGLYFSVKKYLETNQNFDKIIFVVTIPGRLYVPQVGTTNVHISNIVRARFVSENSRNLTEKNIYSAALNYLLNIQNYEEELFKHYCMLDRIIRSDSLLLVPVCSESLECYSGTTLNDVSLIDSEHYDIDQNLINDLRCCHMNQRNNEIFADKIYEWIISGKFNFKKEDFTTPTETEEELFDSDFHI